MTLEVFNTSLQQWAFSDPISDYHTTDPCEAFLIAPIVVDGVQFLGVTVVTKSYNLTTGDANDCVKLLQGFTSLWNNHAESQEESTSGMAFLMSKILGHGLSPYPLLSWIVVDSCTVDEGLRPKPGDVCGSYEHNSLTFRMMFVSKPYVNHLGNNCMHTFVLLECRTPNDPEQAEGSAVQVLQALHMIGSSTTFLMSVCCFVTRMVPLQKLASGLLHTRFQ